MAMTFRSY